MNAKLTPALTQQSFWKRLSDWLEPYGSALSQSPMEHLWDRVDQLEREIEQLKTTRTR